MEWLAAVERLRRERRPGVLVTLTSVRGHSPREAGAKMVVARDCHLGQHRRRQPRGDRRRPGPRDARRGARHTRAARAVAQRQGARRARSAVLRRRGAGAPRAARRGAVGRDLRHRPRRARAGPHPRAATTSSCTSSTPAPTSSGHDRLGVLDDAVARVHVHHAPVPELVLGQVPRGTHVLIMTHDHAEDAALCDGALRCEHLGSIGLIGSSAKWRRFRADALRQKDIRTRDLARIQTPDRAARAHRQGPGDHRRERRRRPRPGASSPSGRLRRRSTVDDALPGHRARHPRRPLRRWGAARRRRTAGCSSRTASSPLAATSRRCAPSTPTRPSSTCARG